MITTARLENFKGLRDLKIPELRRITLPGGQNNVGKSSVPEALFFREHSQKVGLSGQW